MTAPSGGGGPSRSSGASAGVRGAVVVGLAVILGIVGLQILDDSGPSSGDASLTATGGSGSTGTGASPTTTPVKPNSQVRVKVYNASGTPGRAQTLTNDLRGKNYNMQTPANLSGKRAGTTVQCVDGFQREATPLAVLNVGNGATVQPYPKDPPAGASDADCIVIIGTA